MAPATFIDVQLGPVEALGLPTGADHLIQVQLVEDFGVTLDFAVVVQRPAHAEVVLGGFHLFEAVEQDGATGGVLVQISHFGPDAPLGSHRFAVAVVLVRGGLFLGGFARLGPHWQLGPPGLGNDAAPDRHRRHGPVATRKRADAGRRLAGPGHAPCRRPDLIGPRQRRRQLHRQ